MLKISSKRRRTLKQIRAEKMAAEQEAADTKAKLAQFDAMQAEMIQMRQDMEMGKVASDFVSQFINAGMV